MKSHTETERPSVQPEKNSGAVNFCRKFNLFPVKKLCNHLNQPSYYIDFQQPFKKKKRKPTPQTPEKIPGKTIDEAAVCSTFILSPDLITILNIQHNF